MERKGSCPTQQEQFSLERKNSLPGEKRRPCYSWERTGMCRLGSSCQYAHEKEYAYVPPDTTHRLWSNMQASTSTAQTNLASGGRRWNFTIMSYNILADELATSHMKELYIAVPEHCIPWQHRLMKLIKELLHWRPDIICLQEVDHPQDFIAPLQPLGYAWEYAARTGGRTDGCLTLWRADKFQAIAWDKVQMNNYNLKDNVALIVVLRLLGPPNALNFGTSPAIAIANTHLIFNPKRGDIKLGQAGLIMRRMSAICNDMKIAPLSIFTGDFNSTPQSGIYSFIHDGELDCFLEDRRLLSGQLESRSNDAWPPTRVVQRELEVGHSIVDRKRGASLDDPSRWYRTCLGLQQAAPPHQMSLLQRHQVHNASSIGIVMNQRQFLGSLNHSSSSPQIAGLTPHGLRDARHSGPVTPPGEGPLYPYTDEFGQIAWSHIPPSDSDIKRQPFYHQPMVVEEAKPPLPPPPSGILRSLSFAERQANATTWSHEQLMTATGSQPDEGARYHGRAWMNRTASAGEVWIAAHPLPMRSTYEAVLGTEPAYTSCHSKFIGTVDYIWFTPEAGRLALTPTNVLLPPPIDSLHCGLPSPEWPSDHISLLAHFTLTQDGSQPPPPPGSPPAADRDPVWLTPTSEIGLSSVKEGDFRNLRGASTSRKGLAADPPKQTHATYQEAAGEEPALAGALCVPNQRAGAVAELNMASPKERGKLHKAVEEGLVPRLIVTEVQHQNAA